MQRQQGDGKSSKLELHAKIFSKKETESVVYR